MNTTKLRCALYRLVLLFGWGLFLLLGQTTAAQTCTGEVLNISATNSIQTGTWMVPSGGPYLIRVTTKGAKGGGSNFGNGGKGATLMGNFIVLSGQILAAKAGASGFYTNYGGSGGDGSGVQIQGGDYFQVAGAGGGGGLDLNGKDGLITSNGSNGHNPSFISGGIGGTNGTDGGNGSSSIYPGVSYGFGGKGVFNGFTGGPNGNNSYGVGGGGGGGYSGGGGTGGSGGSYNLGSNQTNTAGDNNAGGQVIIECLGTATYSATVTPTQPTCTQSGSISIDFTGDFNNNTSGGLEYAIVAGNSFTGTPTFSDVTADPLNVTSGVGTMVGTYTVRIRLKYNPTLYVDKTYTLTRPCNCTYYVNANATGANNGSSWADAFTSLQDALETVCSGGEIWVAKGTYYPTADASGNKTPSDPRTKAFVMKNGVAIYGGFNGTESQLTARDWRTNATILSGNIGNSGVDTDNSYQVINNTFTSGSPLNNTAVLDGFIVEKGYANGGFPRTLGGGMWNTYASPTVRHCVFRNNYALSGGGMFNDNSQATITNCLFVNNTGTTTGAGLSSGGGTELVKIINCTFYGNTGPITIYNEKSATTVSNSIIWGNGGGISGGTVTYSNVQGGVTGTGNLSVDPRFVDAAGGDFRLQQCSPAIDKGTNTDSPTTDFAGNVRPFNATGVSNTDMGAYEYQSTYDICSACANTTTGILYVNASALGSNNGSSWANAFTDLQAALSMARSYPFCVSQIWVAKGTYKPTSGADRAISFEMVNGVAIYGGFEGGETQLSARNWVSNKTILSGDIGTIDDNGDNSFNVILNYNNGLDNSAILNGFIISGGNANGNNKNNSGGGMNNIGSSPHILNCKFLNNSAIYVGGGINNSLASPLIANCVFFGNSAGADGGAICNLSATSTIINCSFSNNTSPITTVTSINTSSIIVTNCAFWNNFQIVDVGSSPSSRVSISYCISPQTYGGLGNLTANPLFVDAANGDFRLQACSPAINAGDAATTSATVGLVDFAGNPRFYANSRVDMGAYEYQGSLPTAISPTVGTTNPTTCGGTDGSIRLGGFLNTTTYSVTYKKNNVSVSAANFTSDGSGVITLPNLGAGSYTEIVATYGACVSNAATASLQDPAKPVLTLSTIPAICAGATSFTIPYSAPTNSPNKFSISGTGIITVSDGDLSNPITVALSSPASGSSISFVLTVKNAATSCESSTITGSVTVNPVSVGGTVSSAQTICSGTSPADLSLSGQTGNVVKWQKASDANFSNAVDIASTATTLSSATIGNLTADTYFRAVVKSGVCSEAISSTVKITVNSVSVGGTVNSAQTICSGTSPLDLSLSGQTGSVVKWQKSSDANFNNAVDIASTATTLPSATIGNLTGDTYFRAVVKSGVCSEAISSTVKITVNPVSVGGTVNSAQTICSGTAPSDISLSGQTGNVVKWQKSSDANFSNAIDIASTATTLSSATIGNLTADTYFRAVVKSGVCSEAISSTVKITVNSVSVGGTVNSAQTICSGTSPLDLSLSGQTGSVVKWQKSSDANFNNAVDIASTATTLPSATIGNLTSSTYFRAVVKSGVCSEVFSSSVLITVNPVSVGGTGSSAQTICSGTSPADLSLSGQTGNVVKWQKASDANFSNAVDIASTATTLPSGTIGNLTADTYFRAVVKSGVCSEAYSFSVLIQIHRKPTITLSMLQQTLNEGNNQIFCDTDANPVNSLQFNLTNGCVVGTPVWRVQVGSGAWSDWSPNIPVSQLSNNQPHRYQAACDASCPVTYTSPITVQINYRASTPQQVSLVADGVTVSEGESKEVCNIEGNALVFNATCGAGEVLLYSVDGGDYGSVAPTQLVDGQFHNYRVRCRKSDGTASCIETESGVMRLKITNGLGQVPVASLNVTSGCGTPVSFSGTASCGSLTTVWYNASTNVALATLPSQTPTETTSYYARCQAGGGCLSEKSNVVTYTVIPVGVAPVVSVSSEVVCAGTTVTISANCPAGSTTSWNTGVTTPSFEISFSNVTKQTYWAKCIFSGGCQSAESVKKEVYWNAFVVTLINVGQTKSAVKPANDKVLWNSQFIAKDGGPELTQSTQSNPTLYYVENVNKTAPRYWTINVDACGLGTDGSLTFDLLATPETGVPQSFNTHENNAPYFMYANRDGWTELYAQNHPAYGFYQDNGVGGNAYDAGLPKGLYKLGIRYWDQKGWGSIYPSTRKPQGNVLAYQEYWFRIQSKDGVGVGAARVATAVDSSHRRIDGMTKGSFATVMPNPVLSVLRLQVTDSKGQEVSATLLDASGREILRRTFIPETNTHQEEFGVRELPTGMYFLKVSSADNQASLKIIKIK